MLLLQFKKKKKKKVTKSEMLLFAVFKLGWPGSVTESGMAAYSSVQVIISPAAPWMVPEKCQSNDIHLDAASG